MLTTHRCQFLHRLVTQTSGITPHCGRALRCSVTVCDRLSGSLDMMRLSDAGSVHDLAHFGSPVPRSHSTLYSPHFAQKRVIRPKQEAAGVAWLA